MLDVQVRYKIKPDLKFQCLQQVYGQAGGELWLAVVPQEPQECTVRRLLSLARRRLGAPEGVEGAVAVKLERVLFRPQRARAGDVVAPQRSRRQSGRGLGRLFLGDGRRVRRRVQRTQTNVDGRLAPPQGRIVGARIFGRQQEELVGARCRRERGVGLHDHQIAVHINDVVRVVDAPAAGAHGFLFLCSEGGQRVASMTSERREQLWLFVRRKIRRSTGPAGSPKVLSTLRPRPKLS